jgi:acetyl esterase/lipase
MRHLLIASLLSVLSLTAAFAQQNPLVTRDISYATVNGRDLRLDLYLPQNVTSPPLIVWVHGGAWSGGSKADPPLGFVSSGFALASLDFRLSTEARFPAQIHDIKSAVRFLRANASKYGYRADRIAISGSSSGAHLAALTGTTNGDKQLEGQVGGNFDQSSSVQVILSYYGASNLTTILAQSTPFGVNMRVPALERLLGAKPDAVPELAKLASPIFHVDAGDPPLLLFHGDQDPQMPINQSHELQGAYESHHLKVIFEVVHGAAHGGPAFFEPKRLERAAKFIREVLAAKSSN